MANTFIISQDATDPAVTDTLYHPNGMAVDLTGATVRFRMREAEGTALAVDAAASIVSASLGQVSYVWNAADTAAQGTYSAWWLATLSSGTIFQSEEFIVKIDAHAPGDTTTTGEIARQTRQFLPVTWDALSKDSRYGDAMLQSRIDYIKYKLFSTVISVAFEATAYNPLVLDYVAKNVALQVIPAGIEYWMEAHASIGTTGTQESVSYPDRIAALEMSKEWLTVEVSRIRPELEGTFTIRRRSRFPGVGNGNDLRTPNPTDFPKQTSRGWGINPGSTTLPWSPF